MKQFEIVQKLWNLCNILRDDGITYHQYVNELTYLLFLKMADEKGLEENLPVGYGWSDLSAQSGQHQFDFYREQLVHLGTHGNDAIRAIFANPTSLLRHAETLSLLVDQINELDWYSARIEGFGDLYEGLLAKNAGEKKSGAGQYFTPRPLIESMIACMKPSISDVIQDPAAGTGGFLVAAQQYIYANNPKQANRRRKLPKFLGMEHVQDVHRLALMNQLLHGISYVNGEIGVQYGDALGPEGARMAKQGASLVLTNPPFGTKRGGGLPSRSDLPYPTSNKQLAFLQHIYLSLVPNGRAAVVLPDNVLFEGNAGLDVRRDLLKKCNLHTILRLPTGIFYAHGVKTNVLFFTRNEHDGEHTERIWIYDLRTNMPQFGKRIQLQREHFADFESKFGPDPAGRGPRVDEGEGKRFRSFSRKEISDRGDNLDITWLRDDGDVDDDASHEPVAIAQEIAADLEAAQNHLKAILELLGVEVTA